MCPFALRHPADGYLVRSQENGGCDAGCGFGHYIWAWPALPITIVIAHLIWKTKHTASPKKGRQSTTCLAYWLMLFIDTIHIIHLSVLILRCPLVIHLWITMDNHTCELLLGFTWNTNEQWTKDSWQPAYMQHTWCIWVHVLEHVPSMCTSLLVDSMPLTIVTALFCFLTLNQQLYAL